MSNRELCGALLPLGCLSPTIDSSDSLDCGGEGARITPYFVAIARLIAKLFIASLLTPIATAWAQNFSASEPELRTSAEAARESSARFWSGQSLPGRWSIPCPVDWSQRTGPGSGVTSFRIDQGEVFGWRMTLSGSRQAVLRDVLPHEVDHAVRASLCRRPLPRWLDEGCASLFESEEAHAQLRQQRRDGHRLQLTASTIDQLSYPPRPEDAAQLYAEGFSFVEFLLSRGTPRELLAVQRASAPPSQSLVQVYRAELPQLLGDWETWEQNRLAQGTRCDCVNCPWHRTPNAKPTLTIWTASWCGPCQQFHRDLASQPRFRQQLESKFQLIERDIDQFPAAAQRAQVTRVPIFQAAHQRVAGYLGPEWLLQQLGIAEPVPPTTAPPAPVPQPTPEITIPETLPSAPLRMPVSLPEGASDKGQVTSEAGSGSLPSAISHPPLPSPSLWSRILGLAPTVITILSSLGIISGTALTGGVGGVALMLALKLLQRRATRAAPGTTTSTPAPQGGVAPSAQAPFPRQLDEAGQLLGLRQSEGRVATLDTLRGMFLDDELDKLTSDADPQMVALVRQIRTAVDTRVDEVAPLTTQG